MQTGQQVECLLGPRDRSPRPPIGGESGVSALKANGQGTSGRSAWPIHWGLRRQPRGATIGSAGSDGVPLTPTETPNANTYAELSIGLPS